MKKCFELAQSCINTDQHKRPIITEILDKLYEIESQIEKVIPVDETSVDQVGSFFWAHGLYIGTSLCGLWCIFHAMSHLCVHFKFSLIVLLITVCSKIQITRCICIQHYKNNFRRYKLLFSMTTLLLHRMYKSVRGPIAMLAWRNNFLEELQTNSLSLTQPLHPPPPLSLLLCLPYPPPPSLFWRKFGQLILKLNKVMFTLRISQINP